MNLEQRLDKLLNDVAPLVNELGEYFPNSFTNKDFNEIKDRLGLHTSIKFLLDNGFIKIINSESFPIAIKDYYGDVDYYVKGVRYYYSLLPLDDVIDVFEKMVDEINYNVKRNIESTEKEITEQLEQLGRLYAISEFLDKRG